jgi:cysteine desulfurase/selenocysteine lyase
MTDPATPFDPKQVQEWFPSPTRETYFNTAGSALCPRPVRDEVVGVLDALTADVADAYRDYAPRVRLLRLCLAEMMGATPEEIAITHHTAESASIVANGIDWREGDTIITLDREYPSTVYPWMRLERERGVRLVMLEEREGRLSEDEIIAALRRERPRLFALSAVEWCSGWRFELQEIGRVCRELGTLFFVDAAQSLGFWPFDVRACHISALAGSAWKWLLGPPGQGYLYLRRGLLDEVRPVFVGSETVVNAHDYLDYNLTPRPGMRRFEYSTGNLSALVWFGAAVRFVRKLGLDEIRAHVFALQDYALERLGELGCELRGGGPAERRSGIIAFRHPTLDSPTLERTLREDAGIRARERDGFIRLSFHAYNSRLGVDALIEQLSRL